MLDSVLQGVVGAGVGALVDSVLQGVVGAGVGALVMAMIGIYTARRGSRAAVEAAHIGADATTHASLLERINRLEEERIERDKMDRAQTDALDDCRQQHIAIRGEFARYRVAIEAELAALRQGLRDCQDRHGPGSARPWMPPALLEEAATLPGDTLLDQYKREQASGAAES